MNNKPEAPNWAAASVVDDYTSFSRDGFWGAYHWQAAVGLQRSGLLHKAGRVLDIGCGPGWMTFILKDLAPQNEYVGVDLSDEMVEMAREMAAKQGYEGIEFAVGNALDLPFADESFDLVTSCFSFRLWGDQVKGLREAYRLVRPGGLLYIADISGDVPMESRGKILEDAPASGTTFLKLAMELGLPSTEVDRILAEADLPNPEHRIGGMGGFRPTDREVVEWMKNGFPLRKLQGLLQGKEWSSELGKYWTHLYIRK